MTISEKGRCPFCGNPLIETYMYAMQQISEEPFITSSKAWQCSKCPMFRASALFTRSKLTIMQRENETNQEAEERIRKQFDDNGMSIKINTRTINRGVNCERANKP